MRTITLIAAAALALLPLQATAQSGVSTPPPEVLRVGGALRSYMDATLSRVRSELLWNADGVLNAPPSEVQSAIAAARGAITAERTRINGLPMPDLSGQDIDLTFIGVQLRADALRRLDNDLAAVDAVAAMVDAQVANDCDALSQRTAAHRRLQAGGQLSFNETSALQSVLSSFAGQPGPPIPVSVQPPPSHPDRVRATVADTIAKSLRCPLLGPDARAEFVVQLAADGAMTTTITDISPSGLRESVAARIATARFPTPSHLRNSQLTGQPLRFTLANQRVSPTP